MAFDLRTIALLVAAASGLQAIILVLFSGLVGGRYPGVRLWALGSIANALGFVLILPRGSIPDVWSIVVANTALAGAIAISLAGINRFLDTPRPRQERLAFAVVLATATLFVPLTYVAPDVGARTAVINAAIGALDLLCAVSLLRAPPQHRGGATRFTAAVFGAAGAWHLYRVALVAAGDPLASVFSPTLAQTLTFLMALAVIMLWGAGVVAIVIERLLRDVRAAQAAERAALESSAREAERRAAEARDLLDALAAANQIVREREQVFRLTFDRSPLGAAMVTLDGRFLRVNESLARITGYDEAALLRRDVFALLSPEERAASEAQARSLLGGADRITLEARGRRADGTPAWWQLTAGLVRDEHGTPLHMITLVEDITERREVEAALRRSNARLELALWGAELGLWDWHVPSGTMDTNAQLAHMIGLTPQALNPVLTVWSEHTHPEDIALVRSVFDAVIAGEREVIEVEFRIRHADGGWRWCYARGRAVERDAAGRALRLIGVTRDITARRTAEDALREREALLRSLTDNLPKGYLYQMEYDAGGTPRFTYLSGGVTAVTGVAPEDAYRDPELIRGQLLPEDRRRLAALGAEVTRTTQVFEFEGRARNAQGTLRWMHVRSTPRFLDDGRTVYYGLALDITGGKQTEEALQRRVHELTMLYQITHALTSWTNLAEGLAPALALLRETFGGEAALWDYDPAGDCLRRLAVSDRPELSPTLTMSQSGVPPAALAQATVTLLDLGVPPLVAPDGAGPQVLVAPLRARGALVGLLCLRPRDAGRHYTPDDVALAQTIAGVLASALDNAHLFAQARSAAAEHERRRLARELHDSVSQALFAASRIAETLPRLWELDPEEGREALGSLHGFTTGALAEMRALLVELRPPALLEAPLDETLAVLAPTARARGVAEVHLALDRAPLLPPAVQVALYRVAQEALNNVIKHARATSVAVSLAVSPAYVAGAPWEGTVTIGVADDGRGFTSQPAAGDHFGLATMRERAAEIGASLAVTSAPGEGTQVIIRWRGVSALVAQEIQMVLREEREVAT